MSAGISNFVTCVIPLVKLPTQHTTKCSGELQFLQIDDVVFNPGERKPKRVKEFHFPLNISYKSIFHFPASAKEESGLVFPFLVEVGIMSYFLCLSSFVSLVKIGD